MRNITVEILRDGDIEQCRQLCDELMALQKSKAVMRPELFDFMNFDTRMRKSYDSALRRQVVVMKDQGIPVGYVFSTIDEVDLAKIETTPDWMPAGEDYVGFYPDWVKPPRKVGCLNNLYLRDAYRGAGMGSKLFDMAMEWLEGFPDVDLTFVYVSNGNDGALRFYLNHGFAFSHDVFGGFITAAYKHRDNLK